MLDRFRGKSSSLFTQIIFGIIILSFIFLGVGSFSGGQSSGAATVNSVTISLEEFAQTAHQVYQQEMRNNPEMGNSPEALEQLKRQVLNQMILEQVKMQEATRLGIFVTPQELFQVIANISLFQDDQGKFDPKRYTEALKQIGQTPAQFEKGYKESLLASKLLAAATMGVSATEAEARNFFDFQLEQRVAEYVLFASKDFASKVTVTDADLQAHFDANKASFIEPARMNLDFAMITPAALADSVTVAEADVAAFYDNNKERFAIPAEYRPRHILVRAPAPGSADKDAEAAFAKAEELLLGIQKELKAGASFNDLAIKYSQDPGSAPQGGDLGWLDEKAPLVPEFKAAALALKPGEVSAVVRTQFGLHLIKLEDKRPARTLTLAEARESIRNDLALEKAGEEVDALRKKVVAELNEGATFDDIIKKFALKKENTGVMYKSSVAGRLELHKDAMTVLENVAPGEMAPMPLEVTGGVALVRIVSATAERTPELAEVKDTVRQQVVAKKSAELAKAAADEALASFTGSTVPAAFKGKVQKSQRFSRAMPLVMPLGTVPGLADALNALPAGPWAARTFEATDGAVIARVAEVIPVSQEDWEKQGPMVYQALMQGAQGEMMQLYMERLLLQSDVQVNEDAVQAVRFR